MAGVKYIRNAADMKNFAMENYNDGGSIADDWNGDDYVRVAEDAAKFGRTVRAHMKVLFAEEFRRRESMTASVLPPKATDGTRDLPPTPSGAVGQDSAQNAPETPPEASQSTRTTGRPVRTRRAPRSKLVEGGVEIEYAGKPVVLTPRQVIFLHNLPNDNFYTDPTSVVWIDNYVTTLAGVMAPMTAGAMVSTLREKGVITVHVGVCLLYDAKCAGRRSKYFLLTDLGVRLMGAVHNRGGGAGCHGHQERAERAPVEMDKQVRMEDLP